jgi:hypothetical protein
LRFLRHLIALCFVVLALPSQATAATFFGEFWDASSRVNNLTAANAVMAASGPTSTFVSTLIDYPNGDTNITSSTGTTLASYLGVDAGSIVGTSTVNLRRSVFRFTGFLDLLPGAQSFSMGSDDGFSLSIGGVVIAQQANSRAFRFTTLSVDAGEGRTPFEFIYFENQGNTGVELFIDGALAATAPVPLPATLALLMAGLGILGFSRKRRTATVQG